MKNKKILTILMLGLSTQVFADNLSDSEKIFNWAETVYPQYFGISKPKTFEISGYLARKYSETGNYLGTKDGRVYVLGNVFGGLKDVGDVSYFLNLIDSPIEVLEKIGLTGRLNDTGITWGANYLTGSNNTCIGEKIINQDCNHGRDAQAIAGRLSKIGAGHGGFDFTKLDVNGNSLDVSATSWSCVQDNVTGLIWEIKTDYDGLHNKDDLYNWFDTNPDTNGGKRGYDNYYGDICYGYSDDNVENYCNTRAFAKRVNKEKLCGIENWRVPNREELRSIVDYGYEDPAIDTNYFPNTITRAFYWTATPWHRKDYPENVDLISFTNGRGASAAKGLKYFIRLVSNK